MYDIKKVLFPLIILTSVTGCTHQTSQEKYIGVDAAKTMALEASGAAEANAVFEKTEMDTKDGISYYEIDFSANGQKYEYDVDALTGVIIESHSQPVKTTNQTEPDNNQQLTGGKQEISSDNMITEDEAKEIALNHAGLKDEDVTFVKLGYEREIGYQKYEIEFYTSDYKEYDYEINAETGEIISYDYDAEYYTDASASNGKISAEEAKNIALSQVPGATAEDIYEFETDYDDGRLEYEGKIYYSSAEYEFSIDGYSGAIRSWEYEPIFS